MRLVVWEDRKGKKHRSMVRDEDPDEAAPKGVPCDPPDLGKIDWEEVQTEIHNRLVELKITNWPELQASGNALSGIVQAAVRRRIILLFKLEWQEAQIPTEE